MSFTYLFFNQSGGRQTPFNHLICKLPRCLLDFANNPIVLYQAMLNFKNVSEAELGLKITLSEEAEPLDTTGPLALAKDLLLDASREPFLVLNAYITNDYPLKQIIDFHIEHDGEATELVSQSFQEIPQKFVGNRVNAGVYLMNPSVLNRIELTPTSMETKVFLNTVADRKLYAMFLPHEGFWMEIGGQRD
ncbi:hypothetical protein GLYMA_11G223500v4 [Glycine max]|nr:hypothetical protein GLYMA_11G223500v4 [Glycine max]KAH1160329.1 hypothetical protein GYH30_031892 [Glycine max]